MLKWDFAVAMNTNNSFKYGKYSRSNIISRINIDWKERLRKLYSSRCLQLFLFYFQLFSIYFFRYRLFTSIFPVFLISVESFSFLATLVTLYCSCGCCPLSTTLGLFLESSTEEFASLSLFAFAPFFGKLFAISIAAKISFRICYDVIEGPPIPPVYWSFLARSPVLTVALVICGPYCCYHTADRYVFYYFRAYTAYVFPLLARLVGGAERGQKAVKQQTDFYALLYGPFPTSKVALS